MLGLSVADPVPSSSWDVPDAEVSDAEISDSEQPARSKAAEHATITRSALLAKDSQPLLIGAAPTLPEGLSNLILILLPVWLVVPASPGPQRGTGDCRHELRRLGEQSDRIHGLRGLCSGWRHEQKDRSEHDQGEHH